MGGEFLINDVTQGYQGEPRVAFAASGNAAVAWVSDEDLEDPDAVIRYKIVGADGSSVSTDMKISAPRTERLELVDLEPRLTGGFSIRWNRRDANGKSRGQQRQDVDGHGKPVGPVEDLTE